jgi:hypothetical protein
MFKSFLSLALLACALTTVRAQDDGFNCRANDPVMLERMEQLRPGFRQQAAAAKERMAAHLADPPRGGGGSFVIPVVFHIIHANGIENISDAQIQDAVRVLNEDFNRQNSDWDAVRPEFLDRVADVGIEFRLAQLDPFGNCTNGITRTVSNATFAGDFDMTQLIQWPRDTPITRSGWTAGRKPTASWCAAITWAASGPVRRSARMCSPTRWAIG